MRHRCLLDKSDLYQLRNCTCNASLWGQCALCSNIVPPQEGDHTTHQENRLSLPHFNTHTQTHTHTHTIHFVKHATVSTLFNKSRFKWIFGWATSTGLVCLLWNRLALTTKGEIYPPQKTIKLCNKWELTREHYLHFCLHGNLPRWSFWGYGWYRPGSTQLSACINPLSGSVWLFWNGILHHLNSFHLVHWDEIKGLSAPDKDVLLDSL